MPSSVIRSWHYDADAQWLDVVFTSGRGYRYFDVPEAVVAGLAAAGSKGSYLNREIRERFAFEPADERWLPE